MNLLPAEVAMTPKWSGPTQSGWTALDLYIDQVTAPVYSTGMSEGDMYKATGSETGFSDSDLMGAQINGVAVLPLDTSYGTELAGSWGLGPTDDAISWVESTLITDPLEMTQIEAGTASPSGDWPGLPTPIGPQPHSVPISYPESVGLRLACWAGLDPDYVLPPGVEPPPRDSTDVPEGPGGGDSTAVNATSYFASVFQCIGNVWYWYYTP
jgi:hypothetical protein